MMAAVGFLRFASGPLWRGAMVRFRFLVLLALVVACGCAAGKGHPDTRTKAILAGATRVEVFRIDGKNDPPGPTPRAPGDPTVGGFAILSRGEDRGQEFAARLATILLSDTTYSDRFASCFWPGVAFRVHRGEECIDVIICFKCQNFYLGPPADRLVSETASFAGSPAGPRLVRLAKEAFPQDKDIQGLEEE
jgi:hypothetical protein